MSYNTPMSTMVIHTDGGSLGNPGPSGCAFIITTPHGETVEKNFYLGEATNNIAEYTAVIKALEHLHANPILIQNTHSITFVADSQLIVEQLSGRYKLKSPHLKELHATIKTLEQGLPPITYTHVLREYNAKADKLVKAAMAAKTTTTV